MSRMTRDNWLVYAIFREIDGKAKAETYRHKVNAKNRKYGISGDGKESPWSLVKGDFDYYLEKRFHSLSCQQGRGGGNCGRNVDRADIFRL